jgi:hypothetical protein
MRLVKAAALSFVASWAGCTEPPAELPRAPADCSLVITRPVRPRLRALGPDGAPVDVGALACAACVVANEGTYALRDAEGVLVVVGGRPLRFNPPPATRLGARSVPGVLLARDAAVIDRGSHLEVRDARALLPAQLEAPRLLAGEFVIGFARRGAQAAWVTGDRNEDRNARLHLLNGYDALRLLDEDGRPIAHVESDQARELVFETGERLTLPRAFRELNTLARGDKVLLTHERERWIGWRTGQLEPIPGLVGVTLADDGTAHLIDLGARTVDQLTAPGQRRRVLTAQPGRDLAGAPLPLGGGVKRMTAVARNGRALAIERIENHACALEDRVQLIDLVTGKVQTVAHGEGLRTVPLWLGDRFGFVEADVEYESP